MERKFPQLQSAWEGLDRVVTWINNVMYKIQWNPRSRKMMVHLDLLALIRDPLRMSSLKEGAAGTMGEETLGEPGHEEGRQDQSFVTRTVLGKEGILVCL
jgi:hypothetical protein